jgi:hypothetical protein
MLGICLAVLNGMPLYYFKLVDSRVVADYGTHELEDDTAAQIEAIKLADLNVIKFFAIST